MCCFGMMIVNGMSTPNQESIRSMHKALFSNIDDDDGMAQTIATIQGIRGKPRFVFMPTPTPTWYRA